MSRVPATPSALLSAIVTFSSRPADDCVSPDRAALRALIERGRHFTWCDPADGWIEPDAHRTYKAALADLREVTGEPPFTEAHPDTAATFARYCVVDLRSCLPLLAPGDAPGALRCGPGTGVGTAAGWPAGWMVPDADDPARFTLRRDFPET